MKLNVDKLLSGFLLLVAAHSFLVGLGLIFLPSSAFELLGFNSTFDRFFSTQGGVFHIAMSVCYGLAAKDKNQFESLIIFSVVVKFLATIFLIPYYFLISSQLLIIFSGISDFIMGLVILILFFQFKKTSVYKKVI